MTAPIGYRHPSGNASIRGATAETEVQHPFAAYLASA